MRKGILISFEGPEGSGKSTHIQRLASYLRQRGHRVQVTREPGGTRLAESFRRLLLETGDGLGALAELFLYEADRAQHVDETLRPALKRGWIVLCDRYTDSTIAYQGFGRQLPIDAIKRLNDVASQGVQPDLTILLDVPADQGLQKAAARRGGHDRLERAGLPFHRRVRSGFLALAKAEPRRIKVIRQQRDVEDTQRLVRAAVETFLKKS